MVIEKQEWDSSHEMMEKRKKTMKDEENEYVLNVDYVG